MIAAGAEHSMLSFPVLSALVLVPVAGALLVALLSERRPEFVKLAALASSVVTGGISLWMTRTTTRSVTSPGCSCSRPA